MLEHFQPVPPLPVGTRFLAKQVQMRRQRIRRQQAGVQDLQAVRCVEVVASGRSAYTDAGRGDQEPVDAVLGAFQPGIWKAEEGFVPEVDACLVLYLDSNT